MGLAAGHASIPHSHHPSGAPQAATDLVSVVFVSGSLGTASSTITSAHSPWQRIARAKQFASRIAKSLDQKGVIMRLSIRMAQPCCSLTTLNVIIAFHRKWLQGFRKTFGTTIIIYSSQRIGGVDLHQIFSRPGSLGKQEEASHAGEIELSSLDPSQRSRLCATPGGEQTCAAIGFRPETMSLRP